MLTIQLDTAKVHVQVCYMLIIVLVFVWFNVLQLLTTTVGIEFVISRVLPIIL